METTVAKEGVHTKCSTPVLCKYWKFFHFSRCAALQRTLCGRGVNRQGAKRNRDGARVLQEETKSIPTLASSEYGHRVHDAERLDPRDRSHVRIAHVQTEFYRRNNVNISPTA